MMLPTLCTVTVVLVIGLVASEFRGARRARYVLKPLASVGFLATAIVAGAFRGEGTYGLWIFAGLVLSFWGDVFLMADDRPRVFLAGLGSFLLGHLAYVVAFVSYGVDPTFSGGMALALVPVAIVVWRWLRPHLSGDMVAPVLAYVVVISMMVALATGAWGSGGSLLMPVGATLFWVSDIAVARRQFVDPSPGSTAWGLPLYYVGQLVLAVSIAKTLPSS
jgi:uncharacterized membrane protein YhhN